MPRPRADLGARPDHAAIVAEAVHAAGRLDILVNNAGLIRRADALEFSEADWDVVMDVNLKAAFFLAQAFARQALAAERGGKVINVASMLSFQGGVRVASYTASKSGLAASPGCCERVGRARHQRQRNRPWILRHQEQRGAAQRPGAQP
jgi:2-deoxy-D-gluconate 3-dehydrogenase